MYEWWKVRWWPAANACQPVALVGGRSNSLDGCDFLSSHESTSVYLEEPRLRTVSSATAFNKGLCDLTTYTKRESCVGFGKGRIGDDVIHVHKPLRTFKAE